MTKEYYSIITKKFILRTSHDGWLMATRNLYNDVLRFYYQLYLEHNKIHTMNSQNALRELEKMTIVGRDKKTVPEPFPWKNVPLYFRRAAINEAIAAGKSYMARNTQVEPTQVFTSGITFYKGMYKELASESVKVKVYDGKKWNWIRCRLSGNNLLEIEECLSPKIVFKEKRIEFHVPVRCKVDDGRKLKERIGADIKICSLQFNNKDVMVTCCIMNRRNEICAVKFIRGGNNYRSRCKVVLDRIERSCHATGDKVFNGSNKKYWKRLQDISEDMAHQVSRQIVEFCRTNNASIIILPKYSETFTKMVQSLAGSWTPRHLSYRIVEKLNYKAWKSGLLMLEFSASNIGRYCAVCGGDIRKKGDEFMCINGHKGNRYLNSTRNLGMKFIKSMSKHMQ